MNGVEFRDLQRALPSVADVPVIVITASGPLATEFAGLDATQTFMKPLNTARFLAANSWRRSRRCEGARRASKLPEHATSCSSRSKGRNRSPAAPKTSHLALGARGSGGPSWRRCSLFNGSAATDGRRPRAAPSATSTSSCVQPSFSTSLSGLPGTSSIKATEEMNSPRGDALRTAHVVPIGRAWADVPDARFRIARRKTACGHAYRDGFRVVDNTIGNGRLGAK